MELFNCFLSCQDLPSLVLFLLFLVFYQHRLNSIFIHCLKKQEVNLYGYKNACQTLIHFSYELHELVTKILLISVKIWFIAKCTTNLTPKPTQITEHLMYELFSIKFSTTNNYFYHCSLFNSFPQVVSYGRAVKYITFNMFMRNNCILRLLLFGTYIEHDFNRFVSKIVV